MHTRHGSMPNLFNAVSPDLWTEDIRRSFLRKRIDQIFKPQYHSECEFCQAKIKLVWICLNNILKLVVPPLSLSKHCWWHPSCTHGTSRGASQRSERRAPGTLIGPKRPFTTLRLGIGTRHSFTFHNWLVVWNMNFMTFHIYIYWECHHPNWRTHMFQRSRSTNQIRLVADTTSSVGWHSHVTQVLKIAYVGTNYHGNAWQDRDWTLVKPWQSELYTFWTPSLIIMFPTYISAYTYIYIHINHSSIYK